MSHEKIIRAWKNEEYRLNLSDADIAQLPNHPSGLIELTQAELGAVSGGLPPISPKVTPIYRCDI